MAKYQSNLDYNSALKLLKQENALNTKYMSDSAKATQSLNEKLMDYQYSLERQSRQSSYQDTRKDLESAGYNPLLAVGQQSGYTSVGSGVSTQSEGLEASQLSNSATDIAKKFNDMRNANDMIGQGQQRIDIDKLAGQYTNDLNSAKAEHERSMTRGQDISNDIQNVFGMIEAIDKHDLSDANRRSLENSIQIGLRNIEMQERETNSRIKLNSANTLKAYQDRLESIQREANLKLSGNEQKEQTRITKANADYRTSKEGRIVNSLGSWTNAIGQVFGAGTSYGVSHSYKH